MLLTVRRDGRHAPCLTVSETAFWFSVRLHCHTRTTRHVEETGRWLNNGLAFANVEPSAFDRRDPVHTSSSVESRAGLRGWLAECAGGCSGERVQVRKRNQASPWSVVTLAEKKICACVSWKLPFCTSPVACIFVSSACNIHLHRHLLSAAALLICISIVRHRRVHIASPVSSEAKTVTAGPAAEQSHATSRSGCQKPRIPSSASSFPTASLPRARK